MAITEMFSSSRTKIQRANRHIDELRELTSPLHRSLYEIKVQKISGPAIYVKPPVLYELTYGPKKPFAEEFAVIIGDVFSNLRSGLDHIANRIVATWGVIDPKKSIYFPAAPRKNLPAHPSLAPIEQALPGFKDLLLKDIRPDNGGNEVLWSFTAVSNDDKHSLLVPLITAVGVQFNARVGTNFFDRVGVAFNATRPFPLIKSADPITIENDFETTVEVKFGQGTLFKNEAVVPTLTQISEVVSEAVDAVEDLIRRVKG